MGNTLHELANKLQESLIKQQENAHDSASLNPTKYNNLKLKMDSTIRFPHVIITIGISEAVFNIEENIKTDGGLGPDERYVKKWLSNASVIYDLKELYKKMGELVNAKEEDENNPNAVVFNEAESDDVKLDGPRDNYPKRKNKNGYITIEEAMEEEITEDDEHDIEIEIEAGIEQETRGHIKFNFNYSLDLLSNMKNALKAYLNSSRLDRK